MKKSLILLMGLFFTILISSNAVGQESKTIQILDQSTNTPIPGVKLISKNKTSQGLTNLDGAITLTGLQLKDSIVISSTGYEPLTIAVKDLTATIHLQQSSIYLNQLVVTGTRDAMKREDLPMAITTIGAELIDHTKATSTDQLLNKTPGVYMVDLGNEQHSMAIRQPLSYKSLFLYLEDGLPIRTTGVFNHNALLEMNMASFQKIEIIRGPSSSLYGSEAIGGAVNFITLDPSVSLKAKAALNIDNLGLKRADILFTDTYGKVGIVFSSNYAFRTNGYREHSDYEKLATSLKVNYKINEKAFWSNSMTYVDYRADMTGSLDSNDFVASQFNSVQRFTDREVNSLRVKSSLNYFWNKKSKTSFNAFFRDNSIKQNPSYRIKDDYSPWGNPDGDKNLAHSEKNDNSFNSYGLILHHHQKMDWLNSSITGGLSLDYSPSSYYANYISVYKSNEKIYESYTNTDSVLTNYSTNLLNAAGYAQYEISPIKRLKITAAIRFDYFNYNYDNDLDSLAFSGAPDEINMFNSITPKVGFNYKLKNGNGIYGNYSQGFVPPQVGELYRGVSVPTLVPSVFTNIELGSWISFWKKKASLDIAVYRLEGLNEIISVQQLNGEHVNENAGKTIHQGVEYGLNVSPINSLIIRLSGTNADHQFSDYIEKGEDFSGMKMPRASNWIANGEITYKPKFLKGFRIGAEWQHMSPYFLDQANTVSYDGFDILHLRLGYKFKQFETWCNIMNITDETYATNASKSAWGQSYSPGNPRTFSVGIAYTFNQKQ